MRTIRRIGRAVGIEIALPLLLFVVWWFASAASTSLFFPSLETIIQRFQDDFVFEHFVSDVLPSLRNWSIAMVIAITIGVGVGVTLGLAPTAREIFRPLIDGLRSTPAVVLLPVAVALFGIGPRMSIPVIVFAATWPILINTMAAVQFIHPSVHDMRRVYSIGPIRSLTKVIIPAASPQTILGIRQGLALGLTLLVLSELVGASEGIGYYILQAERNFRIGDMWAGMLMLALIGYLINLAFRGVEHALLGWHYRQSERKVDR